MDPLLPSAGLAAEPALVRAAPLEHSAQLYTEERELAAAVAEFVAAGVRASETAVVIGSMARWGALLKSLGALDIDSRAAVQRGELRFFGARTVLATCMTRGVPDRLAFNESVGGVLGQARRFGKPLRVYSDLSDVLWRGDMCEAALALESFWNSLDGAPFVLLC